MQMNGYTYFYSSRRMKLWHFRSSEGVDFLKVLKSSEKAGESAEISVDLHKVVKRTEQSTARAVEISVTTISRTIHFTHLLHVIQ